MNIARIDYLRTELDNERISLGELIEIENIAQELHIDITDDMQASDILNEIDACISIIPL